MLKPVRLLAKCYDKHFAFLIYAQLKAIIDRLDIFMRNYFKVKTGTDTGWTIVLLGLVM